MKPADRKRLEIWVTNRMNEEQADEAPLRLFKISHLVEGAQKKATILEVPVRDQTSATAIVEQLADHATADANVSGGTQKYEIKAQYGNNTLESRGGRFAFKLAGEKGDDDDDMGLGGIEVSGRGITAQLMRHTEMLQRGFVGTIGEILTSQMTMMNALASRVERAETGRSAALELLERMANERLDREVAAEEARRKTRREEFVLNGLQQILVPKLMSQFATTDTKIETLLSTMDDEQLESLMQTVKPEQMPLLLSVYKDIIAKKENASKAEATRKSAANELVDRAEGVGASTIVDNILVKDKSLAEAVGVAPSEPEPSK